MGKGAVIVARHGERIDYYLRDAGSNWLPTTDRKWDPPLTHRGQMQARRLGTHLHKMIETHGLPPIEAVYSSPLVRCCMTAGEAIIGYEQEQMEIPAERTTRELQVAIEPGLVESLNDKWYRSWCLPDSDGTWGGPGGANYQTGAYPPAIDDAMVDGRAKGAAHLLMNESTQISSFLSSYAGHSKDTSLSTVINATTAQQFQDSRKVAKLIQLVDDDFIFSLENTNYKWGIFESRKSQQDRMEDVVEKLSKKHPDGTILLVSHGGPVTHLYERLSGNDWSQHGVSSYTSFSIYKKSEDGCDGWETMAVNDSTHVKEMHMESSDQTVSFV
eukprot:scaffold410_cov267-Chaetoceros_neogracile.AAC.51